MQSIGEAEKALIEIFFPGNLDRLLEIKTGNKRFAYYTTAATAKSIIEKQEVWLRNATVMNDFSEIAYGLSLVKEAFSGSSGDIFWNAANTVFPDVREKIVPQLADREWDWRAETYLSCLSLHDSAEDQNGRLSMWRAYGDVALVINHFPLTAVTDQLGVYSTPVHYLDGAGVEARLRTVAQAISEKVDFLRSLGETVFVDYTIKMVFLASIGTKHPGFSEEKEWRIFFRPAERPRSILDRRVVVIHGVPQQIWALPLRHDPEEGLFHADIPSLLDRIIVGPTPYPYVSAAAFRKLLEEADVKDAYGKVATSKIPLRMRS